MPFQQITIFRLDASVTSLDDFIKTVDSKGNELPQARSLTLPTVEGIESATAKAVVRTSFGKLTTEDDIPWMAFINERVTGDPFEYEAQNKHPSGCIALQLISSGKTAHYALTFGQGGEGLIVGDRIDREFGIKVAMNISQDGALRRIQTSIHEIISTQAERQISTGGPLSSFNIDGEKELLRKLSGKAKTEFAFVKSFTGRESISLRIEGDDPISWEALLPWINSLGDASERIDYRNLFPDYDNFVFETNKTLIGALDDLIFDRIRNELLNDIFMAPPEFVDFDELIFSYDSDRSTEYDDLSLLDWLRSRDRNFRSDSSVNSLKRASVFAFDVNTAARVRTWSVYKCLVAEVTVDGTIYVLSMGQWRRVSANLKQQIDDAAAHVPTAMPAYLPTDVSIWSPDGAVDVAGIATGENRESVYNEAARNASVELFLFDTAKIEIAGEKRYEVCDLLHTNKAFVHAKRLRSHSASISHLFVQARFYADALLGDSRCRAGMRDYITANPAGRPAAPFLEVIPIDRSELVPNQYTVVFAILVEENRGIADLPFMARYELVKTHRHLVDVLGFRCLVCFPRIVLGP